jgi:hypothetical protein
MGVKQNFRQPFLLPKLDKEGASVGPIMSTIWVTTYSPSIHQAGLSIYAAPFFPKCPDGEGIRFLLNVGKFLADYKVSYPAVNVCLHSQQGLG